MQNDVLSNAAAIRENLLNGIFNGAFNEFDCQLGQVAQSRVKREVFICDDLAASPTLMHAAAMQGDVCFAESIYEVYGRLSDKRMQNGLSPLCLSMTQGNTGIVAWLLKKGVSSGDEAWLNELNPLLYACAKRNDSMIEAVLPFSRVDIETAKKYTPLFLALTDTQYVGEPVERNGLPWVSVAPAPVTPYEETETMRRLFQATLSKQAKATLDAIFLCKDQIALDRFVSLAITTDVSPEECRQLKERVLKNSMQYNAPRRKKKEKEKKVGAVVVAHSYEKPKTRFGGARVNSDSKGEAPVRAAKEHHAEMREPIHHVQPVVAVAPVQGSRGLHDACARKDEAAILEILNINKLNINMSAIDGCSPLVLLLSDEAADAWCARYDLTPDNEYGNLDYGNVRQALFRKMLESDNLESTLEYIFERTDQQALSRLVDDLHLIPDLLYKGRKVSDVVSQFDMQFKEAACAPRPCRRKRGGAGAEAEVEGVSEHSGAKRAHVFAADRALGIEDIDDGLFIDDADGGLAAFNELDLLPQEDSTGLSVLKALDGHKVDNTCIDGSFNPSDGTSDLVGILPEQLDSGFISPFLPGSPKPILFNFALREAAPPIRSGGKNENSVSNAGITHDPTTETEDIGLLVSGSLFDF
ncbi:MAG: hypothetical protein V4490_03070 [Pseudomonadota bacterium]